MIDLSSLEDTLCSMMIFVVTAEFLHGMPYKDQCICLSHQPHFGNHLRSKIFGFFNAALAMHNLFLSQAVVFPTPCTISVYLYQLEFIYKPPSACANLHSQDFFMDAFSSPQQIIIVNCSCK